MTDRLLEKSLLGQGRCYRSLPAPSKSQSSEMDCGSALGHSSRRLAMRDVDISGHNPATIFFLVQTTPRQVSPFLSGVAESILGASRHVLSHGAHFAPAFTAR